MKTIHKIGSAIMLTVLLTFGCTDMLEQADPTQKDPALFPADETELHQMLISAYAGLSTGGPGNDGLYNGCGLLALGYLGDNLHRIDDTYDDQPGNGAGVSVLTYTSEDGTIDKIYRRLYQAIFRANQVIAAAPDIAMDPVKRDAMIGEAKFLRGLNFLQLTLLWGDAPIVLDNEIEDPSQLANNPATPAATIYDQVVSDLEDAIDVLPDSPEQEGRVDVWGAKALLSKAYLFGADELGRSEWYSLASAMAQDVIQNSPYALIDGAGSLKEDYMTLFDVESNNNSEYIFAVNHENGGNAWAENHISFYLFKYLNAGTGQLGPRAGWGFTAIYETVVKQWDNADPRKDYALLFDGDSIGPSAQYSIDPDLHAGGRVARNGGAMLQKFWWTQRDGQIVASPVDWPIIRMADVMLIHAEASLMANGGTISGPGLNSLNAVRARADLAPLSSGQATREAILEERRWELFAEGHRWYDLVRTQTAQEAFAQIEADDPENEDFDKENFQAARHYKFPYPVAALAANQGLTQKDVW